MQEFIIHHLGIIQWQYKMAGICEGFCHSVLPIMKQKSFRYGT